MKKYAKVSPAPGGCGPEMVEERKCLFKIGERDESLLRACHPRILDRVGDLVEEFYDHQLSIPEIKRLIGEPTTLERLKAAVRQYVLELFEGPYDCDYVRARLRIGTAHKRIGVPPKLYLAAFNTLRELLDRLLRDEVAAGNLPGALSEYQDALWKVLMFDMELVFDTYIKNLMDEVESARKEIQKYASQLEQNVAELSELSRRDPLTNLFNHRALLDELRREIARSEREGMKLSLAYIDLNGFKQVNDSQGHQRGDRVLQDIAAVLVDGTRSSDIAFRYGGDEFAVVLPNCAIAQARQVCEKVSTIMEVRGIDAVTLSIGIAESTPQARISMDELISAADTAMYKAKELSRTSPGNHIVLAPASPSGSMD